MELDRLDEIGELFDLPIAGEFIAYNDTLLMYMTVVLRSLGDSGKLSEADSAHLAEISRRLKRNAELSSALSSERSEYDYTYMDMGAFLSEFAEMSGANTDGRLCVKLKSAEECSIWAEKEMLMLILLGYIRHILASSADQSAELFLDGSCGEDGEYIIHLECGDSFARKPESSIAASPEFFDRYTVEMCILLARRANMEMTAGEDGMELRIKPAKGREKPHMSEDFIALSDEDISPYELLLSDIF
ncbi:MAG: hypothetical protein IJ779_08015 [Ruminococcus sp.]|nr:hypothetical protein [Ruminococcus sp.]